MSERTAMPRKARAIIEKMVELGTLTEGGRDWLIQATDPFHDTEIPATGYPDINNCSTIVQMFTQTANLISPVGGSSLWDAHIFLNPMTYNWEVPGVVQPFVSRLITTQGRAANTPANTAFLYPGYNAMCLPSGINWQTQIGALLGTHTPAIAMQSSACAGDFRLVAAGFEVVNTTPELYKGGTVTAYRSPSVPTKATYVTPQTGVTITTFLPVDSVGLPPSTQANAQLYPNSKTWAAEEGVYSTATISDMDNHLVKATPNTVFASAPFSAVEMASINTHFAWSDSSSLSTVIVPAAGCVQALPFDNHGCIFVGLQPQATLQVTVKYYVERIPTITQPDLLVLARPPVPFDPKAMEIYTRCMGQLPVAVRVAENPLGEWFNDVLDTVAEYAPKIGNMFGAPGQLIGGALATGARMARGERQTQPAVMAVGPVPKKKKATSVVSSTPVANRKKKRNRKKKPTGPYAQYAKYS